MRFRRWRKYRRCRIPAAQSQDMPLAYGIVRECAARMQHLLLSRVYQNLQEGTAPPCRGAGPTGLRGFTPTDTHIKYVIVDVRPLRCFAPPPLQGGGVYFWSIRFYNPQKYSYICFSYVFSESPFGLADSGIRTSVAPDFKSGAAKNAAPPINSSQQRKRRERTICHSFLTMCAYFVLSICLFCA